jgi:trigger factor
MNRKFCTVLCIALLCACLFGCAARESTIKLGQYKDFTYTPVDTTVTQDEIDAYIENVLANNAERVEDTSRTGTAVQDGDVLYIDYTGYIDGETFEGGSTDGAGTTLTIGSGLMIDGFEDALIGATVGQTTRIDVTFPDPYEQNEALSGKDASFDVEIHYVCTYETPEYNDAFVAEFTENTYTTTAEYESYLLDQMTAEKAAQAQSQILEEIRTQALATCTFDLNEKQQQTYYDEFVDYYTSTAEMYGYTLEDYLAAMGTTMEDFETSAQTYARDVLCAKLFYEAVAEKENIQVTDEEYESRIDGYLQSYGYEGRREEFEEVSGRDVIEENMLFDMVNEKLIEWNTPAQE